MYAVALRDIEGFTFIDTSRAQYFTHLNTPGRLYLDGYVATATAFTAQLLLAKICAIGTYFDLIQYGG